ncbi:MAG: tetratricopeptide repeat protein [Magnetococcales bacterium]|nr:tetratricopeptide repeat protein [Magnetococcales bacterium]
MPKSEEKQQLTVDDAYIQAIDHFNAERYTEADQLCTAIVQAVPSHIDALNLLGVIAQKVNRNDMAIELFQRAITFDANRALLYYNLGISLYSLERKEEAIQALKTALEKEPGNSQIADCLNGVLNSVDGSIQNRAKEALEQGISFHQSGQLDKAIDYYKKAIKIDPENFIALSNMGFALYSTEKLEEAAVALKKAITISPDFADAYSNLGNTLKKQGKFKEAVASFQKAIALKPDYAEAHSNLGNVRQEQDKLDLAVASYQKAIALKPDYAEAHYNLGNIRKEQGKLDLAVASYQKATSLNPDYAEAYNNLGVVVKEQGDLDGAVINLTKAIAIKGDYADAHFNLGNTLREQGKLDLAVASYQKAISIQPDFADTHFHLAIALNSQGKLDATIASYQKAISIQPDNPVMLSNLGAAMISKNRQQTLQEEQKAELETYLRQALSIDPQLVAAWRNLIFYTHFIGDLKKAGYLFKQAVASLPDNIQIHLCKLYCILPIVVDSSATAHRALEAVDGFVFDTAKWLDENPSHQEEFDDISCGFNFFYIAYRTGNHLKALSDYGNLLAASRLKPQPSKLSRAKKNKIRLVIVSAHLRSHSVWDIVLKGVVRHLDRSRFELYIYNIGNESDQETAWAQSMCDCWREIGSGESYKTAWLKSLRQDAPDVVYFPEIGMDPVTMYLASHRTATLQVMGWGHPITSGLPTIDYFLSGELLEPEKTIAQSHYREKLITLPGTGCCTEPYQMERVPAAPEIDEAINNSHGPVFVICQTPFKFDPDDDELFAEIASRVGKCTFIIPANRQLPWASEFILRRIAAAFQAKGLTPESYLKSVPWLSRYQFYDLLDRSSVYLDCPSFSGYTTAWQALHRGLPIVTLEGEFLRQRLAAGLLRKIGQYDTICKNREEYVNVAVDLAKETLDPMRYAARRNRVKESAAKADHCIEVIRAFENCLIAGLEKFDLS